jgi:hypothetical protein
MSASTGRRRHLREELHRAVARINNLALVHDRLQVFSSSVTRVDAAPHFQDLCEMLRSLLPAEARARRSRARRAPSAARKGVVIRPAEPQRITGRCKISTGDVIASIPLGQEGENAPAARKRPMPQPTPSSVGWRSLKLSNSPQL